MAAPASPLHGLNDGGQGLHPKSAFFACTSWLKITRFLVLGRTMRRASPYPQRPRTRLPQERFDAVVLHVWRIEDARLRKKIWRAVCADPQVASWRGELLLWRDDTTYDDILKSLTTVFTPHKCVQFLERAVELHTLTRAESNRAMQSVLDWTAASGQWR
jgi:hypothetical protein